MPRQPAAYTAREAAKIIGRSERLVRALAASGRLDVVGTDPLRVSAASVQRERRARKDRPASGASSPAPVTPDEPAAPAPVAVLDLETIQSIIETAIRAALDQATRMIEAREHIDQRDLIADLAAARAETEQLRQEIKRLRSAERSPGRRWWTRIRPISDTAPGEATP